MLAIPVTRKQIHSEIWINSVEIQLLRIVIWCLSSTCQMKCQPQCRCLLFRSYETHVGWQPLTRDDDEIVANHECSVTEEGSQCPNFQERTLLSCRTVQRQQMRAHLQRLLLSTHLLPSMSLEERTTTDLPSKLDVHFGPMVHLRTTIAGSVLRRQNLIAQRGSAEDSDSPPRAAIHANRNLVEFGS